MDQTNPLSEVTHKRRLSALGPGGLSRERAGFEVRDVHPTHYGRICPIETPEGPNIGLISSLACYARINEYGFIESPYKKVEAGRVLDHYRVVKTGDSTFHARPDRREARSPEGERASPRRTAASTKKGHAAGRRSRAVRVLLSRGMKSVTIAQANVIMDEEGNLVHDRVIARQSGDFVSIERRRSTSSTSLRSSSSPSRPRSFRSSRTTTRTARSWARTCSASPFLFSAPTRRSSARAWRTSLPVTQVQWSSASAAASSTWSTRTASSFASKRKTWRPARRRNSAPTSISSSSSSSNQNTCITQKPIVREGQRVRKGQVLADGPCTDAGELALGRNILVAFMPWRGNNFEDAILVSEKLKGLLHLDSHRGVRDRSARHQARSRRDHPRHSERLGVALRDLDESGIVRIGATVKQGDILVGKVTPKGETQLTPEEKLLRAIFGEKAGDVRDASLKTPPGIEGTVVDVKIFSRKGVEKDMRAKSIEEGEIERMNRNIQDEIRIITDARNKRIAECSQSRSCSATSSTSRPGDILVKKGEAPIAMWSTASPPRAACAAGREKARDGACSSSAPRTASASWSRKPKSVAKTSRRATSCLPASSR